MSPEDGVRWLVETAGVDILEISPVGYSLLEDPALVRRIISAAGTVPVTNYTVGADFLQPTQEAYDAEIERVKRQIHIGCELGANLIRFDSVGWNIPREKMSIEYYVKDIQKIIASYETVCAYARQFDVTILNENHGLYVNGADRIRALMTGVKAENFGHLLDVGNYLCVDEFPEAAIKTVWPFVRHIHVKDFYIRPRDYNAGDGFWFATTYGNHLRGAVVGQGDMNMQLIFRDIVSNGYGGNITLEFEGMEDCLWGVKTGLENTRRLYAEALTQDKGKG
jgi:sugar phosphate isomerase/epimerase